MATGTVKFFNSAKGFGFIAPRDGGGDVFVHVSAVQRSGLVELSEGDEVSFEVERDRRTGKAVAANLEITGSAPTRGAGQRPSRPASRHSDGFERQTRSPAYDDRNPTVAASGDSGVVKWFNAQKGFGFMSQAMDLAMSSYMSRRSSALDSPVSPKARRSSTTFRKTAGPANRPLRTCASPDFRTSTHNRRSRFIKHD